MRTDITIFRETTVRCPQIPCPAVGRPSSVGNGDWIEWQFDGDIGSERGRVVGWLKNPDDGEIYLCVIMELLGGQLCERWVPPSKVINTAHGAGQFAERCTVKQNWLHSARFLTTPERLSRNIWDESEEKFTAQKSQK